MKSIRKSIYLAGLILLLLPIMLTSQNIDTEDSSDIKLIKAAREIMTTAGTCALITLDEEGRPRVRAMEPFTPESDLSVWFGTNPKSRKVNQIKNDSRVTLYYLDSDASGYVMIYGTAQLVVDPDEKENYWKEEWEAFYPNKDGYMLIKVTPIWMEVLSPKHGINNDPVTWQPPTVVFDSAQ